MPLVRGDDRVGLLAVGYPTTAGRISFPADGSNRGRRLRHRARNARLRRRDELQRDLRELIDEFSASISATMNLTSGLEIFCMGAKRLFGADRTSVWIHDRRAHHLVLQGSSDPGHVVRGVTRQRAGRVRAGGGGAAARARRSHVAGRRSDVHGDGLRCAAAAARSARSSSRASRRHRRRARPARPRRRARTAALERHRERCSCWTRSCGRGCELENTFDSIWHLVVVSDRHGRIVQVNEAFANRVGKSRAMLLERPVADYVGHELGRVARGSTSPRTPRRDRGGVEPGNRSIRS